MVEMPILGSPAAKQYAARRAQCNVSLPLGTVAELDGWAQRLDITRSALVDGLLSGGLISRAAGRAFDADLAGKEAEVKAVLTETSMLPEEVDAASRRIAAGMR